MRAEVRIGMLRRPAVENLGERGGLATSRGQILLKHEHEHDVAFGSEVRDILGYDRAAFAPGDHSHLCVLRRPKADLGNMDGVMTVGVAQDYRRSHREHLIDQEGGHASKASRCCDVRRIRSAMARLRSIRD